RDVSPPVAAPAEGSAPLRATGTDEAPAAQEPPSLFSEGPAVADDLQAAPANARAAEVPAVDRLFGSAGPERGPSDLFEWAMLSVGVLCGVGAACGSDTVPGEEKPDEPADC